ncbi:hypothetical protein [Photobacterium leiognathi]|uniref:hypothetical protein n=1 Tax=Photobacterium leiognathi TaxID=553611 RepID=UPI002980AF91|nr:hypothetical protein [Photobacterium leiognathi]
MNFFKSSKKDYVSISIEGNNINAIKTSSLDTKGDISFVSLKSEIELNQDTVSHFLTDNLNSLIKTLNLKPDSKVLLSVPFINDTLIRAVEKPDSIDDIEKYIENTDNNIGDLIDYTFKEVNNSDKVDLHIFHTNRKTIQPILDVFIAHKLQVVVIEPSYVTLLRLFINKSENNNIILHKCNNNLVHFIICGKNNSTHELIRLNINPNDDLFNSIITQINNMYCDSETIFYCFGFDNGIHQLLSDNNYLSHCLSSSVETIFGNVDMNSYLIAGGVLNRNDYDAK